MKTRKRCLGWGAWIGTLLFASCCQYGAGGGAKETVKLVPPDPRPVFRIEVGDAAEVALLQQQLRLEPVRQEGKSLYYFDAAGLDERLRTLGYEPQAANPYEVFHRVVRLDRRGEEGDLRQLGLRLINREEKYWVVEAPLTTLRALEKSGYRLRPLGPDEPRPRIVCVQVHRQEDVQRINEVHVDIFSVEKADYGLQVVGAAFDDQIDRLREAGFKVESCPSAREEKKP